jgi:hypothetical protein
MERLNTASRHEATAPSLQISRSCFCIRTERGECCYSSFVLSLLILLLASDFFKNKRLGEVTLPCGEVRLVLLSLCGISYIGLQTERIHVDMRNKSDNNNVSPDATRLHEPRVPMGIGANHASVPDRCQFTNGDQVPPTCHWKSSDHITFLSAF